MKRIAALTLAFVLALGCFAGCAAQEKTSGGFDGTLEELAAKIYENHNALELRLMTMEMDLNDPDAMRYNAGLSDVAEISEATGVTHKSIRDMIKDNRFEVINNAGGYIRCEMCGTNISSGRLCGKCEMQYHRQMEAEARTRRKAAISGGSAGVHGESGSKRFTRER